MFYVLYNPLCNKGHYKHNLEAAMKKAKKFKTEAKSYNLLELDGHEHEFLKDLSKDDIVCILGGDGTLHQVLNRIYELELPFRIFFYRAGRGNDFSRDHKGNFFEITEEIKTLPVVYINNEKSTFMNGLGIGIDAAVCARQIHNAKHNIKESYFHAACDIFKTFKQFKLKIDIDGTKLEYDDVWFFVVQNGKYFGGGMKVAPYARRDDDHLDVVIIHRVKLRKLLLIFPLIFFGKHTWFKRVGIEFYTGKKITADTTGYDTFQYDGEVIEHVNHIEVFQDKNVEL